MKRLSYLYLVFSLLFFFFFIGLFFLKQPFGPYPLMSVQDAIDVLTPLVLLLLYFALLRMGAPDRPGVVAMGIFVFFAVLWAAGQGMHLSANSISNLLESVGLDTGDVFGLTHFYDEYMSHYLWHIGIVGLSAVLMWHQLKQAPQAEKPSTWPLITGGVIYGFSFFIIIMEGNTAPVGVTFAGLAVLFILVRARKMLRLPSVTFFLTGYALATVLFLVWGIINGGLPPILDVIKL
jgi:hypothetical protein